MECIYCVLFLVRRAAECEITENLVKKDANDLIFGIVLL